MEKRAQPGRAIVPRPRPSEWGFVSSPAATVHAPSLDFGSHVPLAVLTGRLCAAVGMCDCVRDGTERGQVTTHLSPNTQGNRQICGLMQGLTRHFKAGHSVAKEFQ